MKEKMVLIFQIDSHKKINNPNKFSNVSIYVGHNYIYIYIPKNVFP